MSEKKLKRQILKKKLLTKSRLIILNEDSFEEIFSIQLTPMNVFVVGTLSALGIILVTTFIIAFTPLREYIPGYASTNLRKEAIELALKSDSLSLALKKNDAYLKSVVKVLNGELDYQKVNKDSILKSDIETPSLESATASKAEKELRDEVYTLERNAKEKSIKKNR